VESFVDENPKIMINHIIITRNYEKINNGGKYFTNKNRRRFSIILFNSLSNYGIISLSVGLAFGGVFDNG